MGKQRKSSLYHASDRDKAIKTTRKSINDWVGKEVCSEKNSIVNVIERGNGHPPPILSPCGSYKKRAIKSRENILFAVQSSGINLGAALYTLMIFLQG